MPIGETLAQARQQAGLTLAQVSRQTRIRETIIRKIEADDFSECGGDFYARGHIRAIAKAVGDRLRAADRGVRRAPPGARRAGHGQPGGVAGHPVPQRRLPDLPAAWSRVTRRAAAPVRRKARPRGRRIRARSGHAPTRRTRAGPCSWAWRSWWWYSVSWRSTCWRARPRHAPSAAGKHAVTRHDTGHGRPGPAAKASHRAAVPSPSAKARHGTPRRRAQPLHPGPGHGVRPERRRQPAARPPGPRRRALGAAGTPTGTPRPASGTCTRAPACC